MLQPQMGMGWAVPMRHWHQPRRVLAGGSSLPTCPAPVYQGDPSGSMQRLCRTISTCVFTNGNSPNPDRPPEAGAGDEEGNEVCKASAQHRPQHCRLLPLGPLAAHSVGLFWCRGLRRRRQLAPAGSEEGQPFRAPDLFHRGKKAAPKIKCRQVAFYFMVALI